MSGPVSPDLATRKAASPRELETDGAGMPLDKRLLDLAIALPALLLSAPLLLVAALAVRLTSPGPAFFRQTRIGRGERPFVMVKLRTMRTGGDDRSYEAFNRRELLGDDPRHGQELFRLADDPRITGVGRLLRRFSIDELPQLLNVVRGEMSLVGPRPSLPFEVELYTAEQRRRHHCAPGMTGLWQVSGRNRLDMRAMLDLDLAYLERRSLGLDLGILARTPLVVLRGDGVG